MTTTPQLLNSVRCSVTGNPGTGAVTLNAAFYALGPSALTDGTSYYYTLYSGDSNGNPLSSPSFENGVGTYTASGTSFSRDLVLDTSAGPTSTTKINFSSGTQYLMISAPCQLLNQAKSGTNYLANGGMWFFQRQVPGTLTTIASDGYGPDRWRMPSQTASLQSAQVDTNGSLETGITARYYGEFKQITGAGKFMVCQPLEGTQTFDLASRTVTFQCKLKASGSKTIRLGLIQLNSSGTIDTIPAAIVPTTWGASSTDPTLGTNLAYIAPSYVPGGAQGSISGNALNCSVTTAWQQFAATFVLPSNAKNVIPIVWTDAQFAANDILYMTEAGFYDGFAVRDWLPLLYEQELGKCQRFCFAQQSTGAHSITGFFGTSLGSSNIYNMQRALPEPMRASPTLVLSAVSDFELNAPGLYTTVCNTMPIASVSSDNSAIELAPTLASGTGGSSLCVQLNFKNATGFMIFSAEL